MKLTELINIIMTILELFMPIFIGIFILIIGKKVHKKTGLFLTFLILLGASSISDLLDFTIYTNLASKLTHFSILIIILSPIVLYYYIDQMLIQKKEKQKSIITIIGSTIFIIGLILYFLIFYYQILNEIYFNFVEVFSLLYLLYISIIIITNIIKHNIIINNQYSKTENRDLNWALYSTLFYLLFFCIQTVLYLFNIIPELIIDILGFICSLIWMASLSYHTLFYENSENLFENSISIKKTVKNNHEPIIQDDKLSEIEQVIQTNELYLNPELTISEIAHLLKIHPKSISQTINIQAQCNFNTYINQFRIQHATQLILDPTNKTISLEGIGQLSGFKSNSTFYKAFKSEMHQTPKQYADAQRHQHTAE